MSKYICKVKIDTLKLNKNPLFIDLPELENSVTVEVDYTVYGGYSYGTLYEPPETPELEINEIELLEATDPLGTTVELTSGEKKYVIEAILENEVENAIWNYYNGGE